MTTANTNTNTNTNTNINNNIPARSYRKEDMEYERMYMEYLKKNFYEGYMQQRTGCEVVMVDNLAKQYSGVDIEVKYPIFTDDHYIRNVEAKSQGKSYLANPTPTFCLEVSSINRAGKIQPGWYIANTNTDTYLFAWTHTIDEACISEENGREVKRLRTSDDIWEMEIMLVDARILDAYLSSQGLTKDFIVKVSSYMRKHGCKEIWFDELNCKLHTEMEAGRKYDYKFTQSFQFDEKPVNLIVKKNIYEKLCHGHYLLTKKGVKVLKEGNSRQLTYCG